MTSFLSAAIARELEAKDRQRELFPLLSVEPSVFERDRPWVVFDLDEVLCNLHDGTQAALAKRFGTFPHWSMWNYYGYYSTVGLDLAGYLDILIEDRVCEDAPIEPGAVETVNAIRAMGYRTAVVTARGYHPRGDAMTNEWLGKAGIRMDAVRIVDTFEDKSDVICTLGPVAAYVDDLWSHLTALSRRNDTAVLVLRDRPWNQSAPAWFRALHITEFADLVLGHATLIP